MKSQDDGGRGPGGSDRGVTPRYITQKSLVTSAWRPPKQPDNISCFQQDRVFCLYGMLQIARNATDEGSGFLCGMRYLLHDRDTKFCTAFLDVLRSSGIRTLALPPRSPNLNSFSERWVCSIRQECLSKLILFGETSLRRALDQYIEHHHFERNHQGKSNLLLFSSPALRQRAGPFPAATDSAVCLSSTPESLDSLTTRGCGLLFSALVVIAVS